MGTPSASEVTVTADMMQDAIKEVIDAAHELADEEVWDIAFWESEDPVPAVTIGDAFSWFIRLNMTTLNDIDGQLDEAVTSIHDSDYDTISNSGAACVENWDGKAAQQYVDKFAAPFSTATVNQGQLIMGFAPTSSRYTTCTWPAVEMPTRLPRTPPPS